MSDQFTLGHEVHRRLCDMLPELTHEQRALAGNAFLHFIVDCWTAGWKAGHAEAMHDWEWAKDGGHDEDE